MNPSSKSIGIGVFAFILPLTAAGSIVEFPAK